MTWAVKEGQDLIFESDCETDAMDVYRLWWKKNFNDAFAKDVYLLNAGLIVRHFPPGEVSVVSES